MIKLSIDVTRIPPGKTVAGKPKKDGSIPRYLGLVLFDNREGKDQWGNDGYVALDVTKEERLSGVKGVIVGNWKELGGGQSSRPQQAAQAAQAPQSPPPSSPEDTAQLDDIPF